MTPAIGTDATDCCVALWRLCLSIAVLLGGHRVHGAAAISKCSWGELDEAVEHLNMCNPQLSAISTTILLQTGDNPDFTLTCRMFQDYVECMYPVFMCPSLLKGFWTNFEAYKRPPYRCRPRNGTALLKHYKFTMDAPSNSCRGYMCVANHVVTITAVMILASHIQSRDI